MFKFELLRKCYRNREDGREGWAQILGLSDELRQQNFGFDGWEIVPSQNLLRYGEQSFHIEPMIMDVMVVLAKHSPELVTRDALRDQIWKLEHGGDESLTRSVSILRKLLASQGSEKTYIETIRKRGYRLTEPVSFLENAKKGNFVRVDESPHPRVKIESISSDKSKWIVGSGLVALLVFAGLMFNWFSSSANVNKWNSSPNPTIAEQVDRKEIVSIAVLPFKTIAATKNDEYIGHGITEELLNVLAGIEPLKVASRTSAFQYKDKDLDIRSIGEELGVTHIVEGSVQRSGDKLRITSQLIRAEDGFHVWSETFDRDMTDVFATQNDVVREVSNAIQIRLGVGGGDGFHTDRNIHPVAQEQYFKSLHLWSNRMRKNGALIDAYHAVNSAVEIDPEFGEAWAFKVHVLAILNGGPLFRDRLKYIQEMEDAISKAAKYAPDNGTYHASLVIWYARSDINLTKARYHMQRAQELSPQAYQTEYARAIIDFTQGDHKSAIEAFDRAISLNPDDLIGPLARAIFSSSVGRSSDAFEFFDECQAKSCLGEGFVPFASTAAALSGDPERIKKWSPIFSRFDTLLKFVPRSKKPEVVRVVPTYMAMKFDRKDKNKKIKKIQILFQNETITDSIGTWAPTFAEILPRERFMDILETAVERKDLLSAPYGFSPYYGTNPYPEWVLKHPRYHALWERPGMKELAETRRKNGWTDGLPIITDE